MSVARQEKVLTNLLTHQQFQQNSQFSDNPYSESSHLAQITSSSVAMGRIDGLLEAIQSRMQSLCRDNRAQQERGTITENRLMRLENASNMKPSVSQCDALAVCLEELRQRVDSLVSGDTPIASFSKSLSQAHDRIQELQRYTGFEESNRSIFDTSRDDSRDVRTLRKSLTEAVCDIKSLIEELENQQKRLAAGQREASLKIEVNEKKIDTLGTQVRAMENLNSSCHDGLKDLQSQLSQLKETNINLIQDDSNRLNNKRVAALSTQIQDHAIRIRELKNDLNFHLSLITERSSAIAPAASNAVVPSKTKRKSVSKIVLEKFEQCEVRFIALEELVGLAGEDCKRHQDDICRIKRKLKLDQLCSQLQKPTQPQPEINVNQQYGLESNNRNIRKNSVQRPKYAGNDYNKENVAIAEDRKRPSATKMKLTTSAGARDRVKDKQAPIFL